MTEVSPFEANIAEQPDALRALVAAGQPSGLAELLDRPWERIVLTGMGSSHYAGLPTWRRLVETGRAAWAVDAGRLLDTPGLITPETVVIATSQSGASGELVELLSRSPRGSWGALVGIAADASSPLATRADLFVPLHSGDEATVSTKSYLNSLAVHRRLAAAFLGSPPSDTDQEIAATATAIETLLSLDTTDLAVGVIAADRPRIATIGWGDAATTALYAALIIKESSKVAVQGFDGGEFRHGPLELAGDGLTAIIFGAAASTPAARLAADLLAVGSSVILVGDLRLEGATTLLTRADDTLEAIVSQSIVAESLAVSLSRANGVVPGTFRFGSKVTAKI